MVKFESFYHEPALLPLPMRLKIIYTGGTLGMRESRLGLVPAPGLAERLNTQLEANSELHEQAAHIQWEMVENSPLLDSANVTPANWEAIAEQCQAVNDCQGIVVIHGTDTLAYSASALAFLLQHIEIPVILTGAQKPLGVTAGDALQNLVGAMRAASKAHSGVWVYFHHQLMPAARVVKKDAISFQGFTTPRLTPLVLNEPPSLTHIDWQPQPREWEAVKVATTQIIPGYSADQLEAIIATQPSAIILSLFGLGTLPDQNHAITDALDAANQQGIVMAAISQCYVGAIDFSVYATGAQLASSGVLNGRDMTLEAAYTKLLILFRLGYKQDAIQELFVPNLAHEITIP